MSASRTKVLRATTSSLRAPPDGMQRAGHPACCHAMPPGCLLRPHASHQACLDSVELADNMHHATSGARVLESLCMLTRHAESRWARQQARGRSRSSSSALSPQWRGVSCAAGRARPPLAQRTRRRTCASSSIGRTTASGLAAQFKRLSQYPPHTRCAHSCCWRSATMLHEQLRRAIHTLSKSIGCMSARWLMGAAQLQCVRLRQASQLPGS